MRADEEGVSDQARPRAHVRGWLLAAALAVSGATAAGSTAAYTSTAASSASVGTASCYYRATVQRGSLVSATDGITAATMSAVDVSSSFLVFTSRHNSNRPVGSQIGGRIASPTSVEFYRDTNEASPTSITIEWSVVTYACGITVQRGSVAQSTSTVDVGITPVASTAQAFVLWSKSVEPGDQNWGDNDLVLGDLTTTSNLQFRTSLANSAHTIWWEVVEFTDASMIRVQRGTGSLTGGALSTDLTTSVPFDTTKAFLLVGGRVGGGAATIASSTVRGRLVAPSTVTIDRYAGTSDMPEVAYQVVELFDGTVVQASLLDMCTGCLGTSAVWGGDLNRATAFTSFQNGSGQNGGSADYTADDVLGTASFSMRVAPPWIHIDRAVSASSNASAAWYRVFWGLP